MDRTLCEHLAMNVEAASGLLTAWTFAAMALVLLGAAVQVAVGAGLSVVCGTFLLLTLGPSLAVSVLLVLNLLVSVAATAVAPRLVLWRDAALVSLAALLGSVTAEALPPLPGFMLKPITACVLIFIALRRPTSGKGLGTRLLLPVGLGGFVSGVLTVWTATPGPVVPVALTHAGRTGDEIRRTMQPISIIGYGLGIACVSRSDMAGALRWSGLPLLSVGALAGSAAGLYLRRFVRPGWVLTAVRSIGIAPVRWTPMTLLREVFAYAQVTSTLLT